MARELSMNFLASEQDIFFVCFTSSILLTFFHNSHSLESAERFCLQFAHFGGC